MAGYYLYWHMPVLKMVSLATNNSAQERQRSRFGAREGSVLVPQDDWSLSFPWLTYPRSVWNANQTSGTQPPDKWGDGDI